MIHIVHTADWHLRGFHYLDEIQYTFDRLYESLSVELCPTEENYIAVPGDIYHSKLTVTNEYFRICRQILLNLSKFGHIIIIPGNHDLALQNKGRLDAISPVVDSLRSDLISYLIDGIPYISN